MPQLEQLQDSREFIRQEISEFPSIMEGDPNEWWRSTVKMLIDFKHKLEAYPDEEIREFFTVKIDRLFEELRKASHLTPVGQNDFASLADHLIMNFSMEIALPFEIKEFQIKTNFLPLEEMIKNQENRFKTEDRVINGENCIVLRVKHPTQESWEEIPLPKNRKVWHKGGPARAVLDIVANAPLSMQKAEFPWHDFDAIVGDKRRNKKAALNIGVDPDGIESMGEDNLNFLRYCAGRDTTQNQVCLGAEGLYFSDDAYETAVTGHTRIENEYVANKAIYGFDKMIVQEESLAKPRGLMRLVKAVAEEKALSFDHIPLNSLFDMGTNILFLAKRWSKKESFPEYLQKMFYLMKQIGQVRECEMNIFDTLERAHIEHPFFDFESEVKFPIEVVRWKSRKLVKQIDREMGWQFQIPTGMDIKRAPGDNIPKRISLDYFEIDEEKIDIEDRWNEFIERSRLRTKEYNAQGYSTYKKIFDLEISDTNESLSDHEDC